VDTDGKPVPAWSDDPILTPSRTIDGVDYPPANGYDYEGFSYIYQRNIQELQDDRRQQETDLGIMPLTEFSSVAGDESMGLLGHVVELRMSTERILDAVGETLQDYFRLDATGTTQPAGPTDVTEKVEWTDVSRGRALRTQGLNASILNTVHTQFKVNATTDKDIPGIKENTTFIRAIHLEDLRHPIQSVWLELFQVSTPLVASVLATGTSPNYDISTDLVSGDRGQYDFGIDANTASAFPFDLANTASGSYSIVPHNFLGRATNKVVVTMSASAARVTPQSLAVGNFDMRFSSNQIILPKVRFNNTLVADIFTSDFASSPIGPFGTGTSILLEFKIRKPTDPFTLYGSSPVQLSQGGAYQFYLSPPGMDTVNIYDLYAYSPTIQAILQDQLVSCYVSLHVRVEANAFLGTPTAFLNLTLEGIRIRHAVE